MENQEMYIRAAKIIATCPASRLRFVLATLEKGGVHFTEEELATIKSAIARPSKTATLVERRKVQNREEWKKTDNKYILRLREAYDKGASLTQIGRIVGINKATAYKYLWGRITPSDSIGQRIVDACDSMNL